jgi:hypothetical protein
MLANHFQGHNGTDGRDTSARIAATGYINPAFSYSFGENVFSYAESVFHGHAAFEVDWGGSAATGGMQFPPGHRDAIHDATFREIGLGVVLGSNQGVGPQLVTQDFGTRGDLTPFVTGVVYQDTNGNGFYDVGEGIGGVTVNVSGSNYYAVTASSGGYSVPVPGNGTYTVNFSGGSVAASQQTAVVAGGGNVKIDYATRPGVSRGGLGNISTRAVVGTDDNVLIGGFIITGNQEKKVVVRAMGPSLPVPGKLANPRLDLYGGSQLLESNDNWQTSPNAQAIIDSTVAPGNSLEAAVVRSLPPGGYTAVVNGVGGTGIGTIEIYDLDPAADAKLANISSRGIVQTGDNAMIGGIIIVGTSAQKVIVRAIGPSLPLAGKLLDPMVELYNQNGVSIGANDNWRTGGQEAEIIASTVPPLNEAEAAIVQTLPPAGYTAIVRGKDGTTGLALVEVYALD